MSRTAPRDDRDLGFMTWSTVDDLVLGIKCDSWVGKGDRLQCRQDQMGRIVDEVFRWSKSAPLCSK